MRTTRTLRTRLTLEKLECRLAPANFTVLNADDSGAGSLRQAILDANANVGADTVGFDAVFFSSPRTITLSGASGQLNIAGDLVITGPGAALLTISGSDATRIFNVDNTAAILNVAISRMTLADGNGNSGGSKPMAADGGAIRTSNEVLTLENMVVAGNATTGTHDGGGIAATGTAFITIRNTTISGNTTAGSGGGIYFANGGALVIENSTVSGNSSTDPIGGGGIYFFGAVTHGEFRIVTSTIAGNSASGSGGGIVLRSFSGTAFVNNSTVTGNSSGTASTSGGAGGGGIAISSGGIFPRLRLRSTIVSGNTASAANGRSDIATIATSSNDAYDSAIGDPDGFTLSSGGGNNLPFGSPLNLLPLANYGGTTQTVALGSGSAALNTGNNSETSGAYDQRGPGYRRNIDGSVDIGAFEVQIAPVVLLTAIGDGSPQRSRVTTIAMTFSAVLTFAGPVANAFTIARNGGGAVNFTASASFISGVTIVTLNNFSGTETQFSSLRDGRYTLTALASQISTAGEQMVSNHVFGDADGLYRLFGDVNGDRRVDIGDFGQFSATFNRTSADPAFDARFDFNNDGRIDIADFGQYSVRFFTTLP